MDKQDDTEKQNRQKTLILIPIVLSVCAFLVGIILKIPALKANSDSTVLSLIFTAAIGSYFAIITYGYKSQTEQFANQETLLGKMNTNQQTLLEAIDTLTKNVFNVYCDRAEGLKYCISLCENENLLEVKNTVLYRSEKSGLGSADKYEEWLNAKRKSLSRGVTWREIISSFMDIEDINRDINSLKKIYPKNAYDCRYIDDNVYSMIQVTLFTLRNGEREVVFGWTYKDKNERGACFSTNNEKVTTYFEEYYDLSYGKIAREKRYYVSTTITDKASDIRRLLPGVWFYVLSDHETIKDIYGIITIIDTGDINTENRYMADGEVWYLGEKYRGKWSSRNMSFNEDNQYLHIHYSMDIENPKPEDNRRKYIGALYFLMKDDANAIFEGEFYDISTPLDKGKIVLAPYISKSDTRPSRKDLSNEEIEYYFRHKLDIEIKNMA